MSGDEQQAEEQEEEQQYYEWSAFYDDEGRLYYYNATTEESSWDEPTDGFNPPPPPDDDDNDNDAQQQQNDDEQAGAVVDDDDDNNNNDNDNIPQSPVNYPISPNESPGRGNSSPDNYPQSPKESPITSPKNYPHSPDDEQPPQSPSGSIGSPTNQPTSPASNYPGSPDHPASPDNYPRSPDQNNDDDDDDGMPQSPANPPNATEDGANATTITWIAYKDEEGNEYYYNNETGDTQWEKPDQYMTAEEYEAIAGGADDDDDEAKKDVQETTDENMDDAEQQEQIDENEVEEENEEPEIDPEVIKVQNAEEALRKPDSILEPSCIANVRIVVPAHGGKPEMAIKALIDSYQGQTAICGLLARWFIDFKSQTTTSNNTISTEAVAASKGKDNNNNNSNKNDKKQQQQQQQLSQYSEADADYIRGIAQDVINRIANERFTREAGDEILDLGKSEAAFLEEMMDSVRWRKLLIDLSASHKDSAVLLHCLRAISKRGHHREIAKRINQSDHFTVFNAMLLSELAVVGCTAVSAGSDINSSSGFDDLLNDLQRACSATSYTYLYSVEMLRTLVTLASQSAEKDTEKSIEDCRFHRAVQKWQALIQVLENAMVDPAAAPSVVGSSPLLRKRRLDVALTISDLHQRQRRRILNTETEQVEGEAINYNQSNNNNGKQEDDIKDLENALLMLLRRYSTGTQIGDAVLDKLLPSTVDMNTRGVGKLLLNHPLSIRALLGHMYKPGTTRINAIGTKNKCARLVALAVLAAEQMTRDEIRKYPSTSNTTTPTNGDSPTEDEINEVALTRMIVQGSQLCEQIEAMISFSVTTEAQPGMGIISPGQKLCSLALKCTPVGIGAMMWAREFTHGTEFPQSASFPTISPNIMSLVRLIAMKHPFTRNDALHIALAFLRHANPDISYQKINALKEQALRLMVCLLIKGDVAPVLTSITNLLSKSGSELDASLVRYFVGGVVDAVVPPFSPVFVRLFSSLLKASRTIDAVRSSYFASDSKKKLGAVLHAFKTTKRSNGTVLSGDDATLVSSLLATYQIE